MWDDLFTEADRQLTICNSCRYCEGYCAVFPALERRTLLEVADITHLASLCHDCRACFHACMYAPPHEFAVDPPDVLGRVRRATYDAHTRPLRLPAGLRNTSAPLTAGGLVLVILLAVVALTEGFGALGRPGGPYRVLPYPALLVTVGVPSLFGLALMVHGAMTYWRTTCGRLRDLLNARALAGAVLAAVRLRNLRGGGEDCPYPADRPSAARRRLHAAVAGGFLLCFAATASAAFLQDVLGSQPPYPLLSAPVVLGTVGGLAMATGCAGLVRIKIHSSASAEDFGLLIGLGLLAATGMLALVLRATPASGPVLLVHLATVVVCFTIAPYTTFVHAVYRFLALVQDTIESDN